MTSADVSAFDLGNFQIRWTGSLRRIFNGRFISFSNVDNGDIAPAARALFIKKERREVDVDMVLWVSVESTRFWF